MRFLRTQLQWITLDLLKLLQTSDLILFSATTAGHLSSLKSHLLPFSVASTMILQNFSILPDTFGTFKTNFSTNITANACTKKIKFDTVSEIITNLLTEHDERKKLEELSCSCISALLTHLSIRLKAQSNTAWVGAHVPACFISYSSTIVGNT